jgi:hypothetical protein
MNERKRRNRIIWLLPCLFLAIALAFSSHHHHDDFLRCHSDCLACIWASESGALVSCFVFAVIMTVAARVQPIRPARQQFLVARPQTGRSPPESSLVSI